MHRTPYADGALELTLAHANGAAMFHSRQIAMRGSGEQA
jgi:hypothetical protein